MSSRNKPVTALSYQMVGEAHTKALEELFHCAACASSINHKQTNPPMQRMSTFLDVVGLERPKNGRSCRDHDHAVCGQQIEVGMTIRFKVICMQSVLG